MTDKWAGTDWRARCEAAWQQLDGFAFELMVQTNKRAAIEHRLKTALVFDGPWTEVEADTDDNDIEVIQHWVPGEGRWRTYVRRTA